MLENININKEIFLSYQLEKLYRKNITFLSNDINKCDKLILNGSQIIESILLDFPLPVFFIKEDKEGELRMIVGNHIYFSIFNYQLNEFNLSDLKILTDLNGKSYSNLEEHLQTKIDWYRFITYVIKPPTPEFLIESIIERFYCYKNDVLNV